MSCLAQWLISGYANVILNGHLEQEQTCVFSAIIAGQSILYISFEMTRNNSFNHIAKSCNLLFTPMPCRKMNGASPVFHQKREDIV